MSIFRKLRRALRGEVSPRTAVWETVRRSNAAMRKKRERRDLPKQANGAARLTPGFSNLSTAALLEHFQQRNEPHFFPGFDPSQATDTSSSTFGEEASAVFASADQITNEHCWPLFGNLNHQFIDWHRDPLSGYDWPLDFYGDIQLHRNDGSDVRVIWELNRLGHLLTLARAYSLNNDRRFSAEFFRQVESWDSRNPFGHGVNWNCAMEVALRAINLLGAFAVFRRAPDFDDDKLVQLLRIFDQHGRFIREHLEFSYIATSNHYLSNIAGLLWLGIMLPELAGAAAWKSFGLRELLREMDKQILPDGADYESSTGYHRLVLEMFCYSFVLCRLNGVAIEERYWQKLHRMFNYLRACLRPDGYAPLLGDTDSGRVFPISHRRGDDHGYLLALGAVLFDDAQLKDDKLPIPPELLWLLGDEGVAKYQTLTVNN
ncbi:MAG TPA: heparinase II/III family protein, partial [Pyrinomonadaceae bacterium]|nr:heparinase II/III family protein [Pyrinomonadaceae bacterium]